MYIASNIMFFFAILAALGCIGKFAHDMLVLDSISKSRTVENLLLVCLFLLLFSIGCVLRLSCCSL